MGSSKLPTTAQRKSVLALGGSCPQTSTSPSRLHLTDRQHGPSVAGDHPGLAHQWPVGAGGGKGLEVSFGLVLESDHAEGHQVEAEMPTRSASSTLVKRRPPMHCW